MNEQKPVLSSILAGALLPGAVLALAASAPLVNDPFITPVDGRILTLGWWFMVPLGTALAVMRSWRAWSGVVVGVFSAVAFHLSMVLAAPEAERAAMLWSSDSIIAALITVVMPWAIGMALGLTSVEHRRRKQGGSTAPGTA